MLEFPENCGLQIIKKVVQNDKQTSRIYGFILYTEKNPYIIKVLKDDDFWNALDKISGSNWPVFSVRPLREGLRYIKSSRQNNINFLVSTWEEPKANIPVLEYFGLENSEELPLFVVFMWDDDNNLNSFSISIKGKSVDEVYNSIEEIVKTIAKVESDILPEYKGSVNVFRNVVSALKALDFRYKVKNFGQIAKKIAEFLDDF